MFIPTIKHSLRGVFSVAALLACTASFVQAADEKRNVILIIGDGMDDQQITIARNHLKGAVVGCCWTLWCCAALRTF